MRGSRLRARTALLAALATLTIGGGTVAALAGPDAREPLRSNRPGASRAPVDAAPDSSAVVRSNRPVVGDSAGKAVPPSGRTGSNRDSAPEVGS